MLAEDREMESRNNESPGTADTTVDLSVSIVNWNTRQLLGECLASIYEHSRDTSIEVIVVDNASSDDSAAMVRQRFPQVRLISNSENVGFAGANNQACRESRGRYVMLLNSDTLVRTDIGAVVSFMDAHPSIGACGCKCLNPDGSIQRNWFDYYPSATWELLPEALREWFQGAIYRRDVESAFPTRWVGGQCMTVRREAMERVGLMDSGYFMYSEETDWCFRLRKSGWEIYHFPGLEIIHYGGQSTRQVRTQMLLHLYASKTRFIRKNLSPARAGLFKFGLYCRTLALRTMARLATRAGGKTERIANCDALLASIKDF